MKKILILLLCLVLSGCGTWYTYSPWGMEKNRKNLMKIEVGMSKAEIISIMGNPHDREAYAVQNGDIVEFLIYLTKYTGSGPIPDRDTTPICFLNGKVTGWGRNFYIEQKKRYEIEIRQTSQ